MSYCNHATPIIHSEAKFLPLVRGDCKVEPTTQRLARLIWQVVGEPVAGRDPRPPKLLWKIMVDDTSKYNWHGLWRIKYWQKGSKTGSKIIPRCCYEFVMNSRNAAYWILQWCKDTKDQTQWRKTVKWEFWYPWDMKCDKRCEFWPTLEIAAPFSFVILLYEGKYAYVV